MSCDGAAEAEGEEVQLQVLDVAVLLKPLLYCAKTDEPDQGEVSTADA